MKISSGFFPSPNLILHEPSIEPDSSNLLESFLSTRFGSVEEYSYKPTDISVDSYPEAAKLDSDDPCLLVKTDLKLSQVELILTKLYFKYKEELRVKNENLSTTATELCTYLRSHIRLCLITAKENYRPHFSKWKRSPFLNKSKQKICSSCKRYTQNLSTVRIHSNRLLPLLAKSNNWNPFNLSFDIIKLISLIKSISKQKYPVSSQCYMCHQRQLLYQKHSIQPSMKKHYDDMFFLAQQIILVKEKNPKEAKRLKLYKRKKINPNPICLSPKTQNTQELMKIWTKKLYAPKPVWVNKRFLEKSTASIPWARLHSLVPWSLYLKYLCKRNLKLANDIIRDRLNGHDLPIQVKNASIELDKTSRPSSTTDSSPLSEIAQRIYGWEKSSLILQKMARKSLFRKQVAALKIQSTFNAKKKWKDMIKLSATKKIQSNVRGFFGRKLANNKKLNVAAQSLQGAAKGFLARRRIQNKKLFTPARKIQQFLVKSKAIKEVNNRRVLRNSARKMQRFYRYAKDTMRTETEANPIVETKDDDSLMNLLYLKRRKLMEFGNANAVGDRWKKCMQDTQADIIHLEKMRKDLTMLQKLKGKFELLLKLEYYELPTGKASIQKKIFSLAKKIEKQTGSLRLTSKRMQIFARIFIYEMNPPNKKQYLLEILREAVITRKALGEIDDIRVFVESHWRAWIGMVNEDLIGDKFRPYLAVQSSDLSRCRNMLSSELYGSHKLVPSRVQSIAYKIRKTLEIGVTECPISVTDCKGVVNKLNPCSGSEYEEQLLRWILVHRDMQKESSYLKKAAIKMKLEIIERCKALKGIVR